MLLETLVVKKKNPAECDQFVTDGHFQKFKSLKAWEKYVVRCDGLLYDSL